MYSHINLLASEHATQRGGPQPKVTCMVDDARSGKSGIRTFTARTCGGRTFSARIELGQNWSSILDIVVLPLLSERPCPLSSKSSIYVFESIIIVRLTDQTLNLSR